MRILLILRHEIVAELGWTSWLCRACRSSDAHHRFIAEESDWGFTRFSELRKLFNIQEGFTRPTIEDDSADVTVFVRVLKDPTGVLWHNFVKSDYHRGIISPLLTNYRHR